MDTTIGKKKKFVYFFVLQKANNLSQKMLIEGFQAWMLRGLSFLLPFLFFGYFWELYNAYVLFKLWRGYPISLSGGRAPAVIPCNEWHVPALSFIFFVLFLGNFLTTYSGKYYALLLINFFRPCVSLSLSLSLNFKS
jgi:hypothetical protein